MHPAPEAVARAQRIRHLVGEQEKAPVARLGKGVRALDRSARVAALPDFVPRREARLFPFLHVDGAVAVQIEALVQALLVPLPICDERADVHGLVAHAGRRRYPALRAELPDGVEHAFW